jgi:hypothetical protein
VAVEPARKLLILEPGGQGTEMSRTIRRLTMLALYQLTVLLGITLLPLAVVTRRLGVPLPLGRAVDGAKTAYETAK